MSLYIDSISDFDILLALAFIMLLIGIYGLITKRSAIRIIMALEILVAAPNIAFIAFGFAQTTDVDPQVQAYVIISLSIGAAVIGLALAFMRNLWKHFGTTNVEAYTTLKG